jgi:hypothetical protein
MKEEMMKTKKATNGRNSKSGYKGVCNAGSRQVRQRRRDERREQLGY